MNQRAQGFILLMFGAALISLGVGDGLLRFVRPYARPYVVLAGVMLALLSVWTLVADYRAGTQDHEHGTDADAHGHSGASKATWLVLAPVVAILVISPPALGSYSASRAAPPVAQTGQKHSALAGGSVPVRLSMLDFFQRAIGDQGRTLTGHRLQLTGFVLSGGDGNFILTRLVITCCAADALPVNVAVLTTAALPARGTWLTVTGTYVGVAANHSDVPLLQAASITPVREPANPYD